MTETKKYPARELKVSIGPNTYPITLPKNAALIDIEARKIQVTNGAHKDMLFGSVESREAYLAVAAACTFEILIPKLKEDLNLPSLFDLDMLQSQQVSKAYEKYYSWMQEWREALNDEATKVKVEEKKENE